MCQFTDISMTSSETGYFRDLFLKIFNSQRSQWPIRKRVILEILFWICEFTEIAMIILKTCHFRDMFGKCVNSQRLQSPVQKAVVSETHFLLDVFPITRCVICKCLTEQNKSLCNYISFINKVLMFLLAFCLRTLESMFAILRKDARKVPKHNIKTFFHEYIIA